MLISVSPALSPVEKVTICPPRLLSCNAQPQEADTRSPVWALASALLLPQLRSVP